MFLVVFVACFLSIRAQNFDFNSATETLRNRCVENGAGKNTTSLLTTAPMELNSCLQSQIDYSIVQTELEEAKKTGSMDEVAQKYCLRYPQITQCLITMTDTFKPCLNSSEQEYIGKSFVFLQLLKDHFCSNSGNNMAMFIAQGGVECLEKIKDDVAQCFNGTDEAQLMSLSEEACGDLMVIRHCFYGKLLNCEGDIPANIVDAFFKHLRKKSGCAIHYTSFIEEDDNFWIRVVIIAGYFIVASVICYKLAV